MKIRLSTLIGSDAAAALPRRRRHWRLMVLFAIGCLSVSSRFVTGLTAEERATAAKLPVFEERLLDGSCELVGPVRGLPCQINQADGYRVSRDNALDELKRASFRDGGNAVMDVRCDTFNRGQGRHNCFRSIECSGDAVRLKTTLVD